MKIEIDDRRSLLTAFAAAIAGLLCGIFQDHLPKGSILFVFFALLIHEAVQMARDEWGTRKRLRERYWVRPCTGLKWRRRFPDAPKEEIRTFLAILADKYGFEGKHRLKFEPNDMVIDVHESVYWREGMLEDFDLEEYGASLDDNYRISCERLGFPEATLGDLFEAAQARGTTGACRVRGRQE